MTLQLQESKLIKKAKYSLKKKQLTIKFKNNKGSYIFSDIDPALAEQFSKETSPGSFFNKSIRGVYPVVLKVKKVK